MGPGRKLRILTFLRHEPYMYELAKTGHHFDLVLVDRGPWGSAWDVKSRPIPPNVDILGGAEVLQSLDMTPYDLLLPQSLDDFEAVDRVARRKVLLLHTLSRSPGHGRLQRGEALRRLYMEHRLWGTTVVYVSEVKACDWGIPGHVIDLAVDLGDYEKHAYVGNVAAALTVAHFLKERGAELGYQVHRQVVQDDIPCKIVGHNPTIEASGAARDWDELRSYYSRYRVYLNTCILGGSMAMLEAMAAGMPVVTTPEPAEKFAAWHVVDGHNGFVSDDPSYLRDRVKQLLDNPELGRSLGTRARETIKQHHSLDRFVREWDKVFQRAMAIEGPPTRRLHTLPDDYYQQAQLVADREASLGKALVWTGDGRREHLLYGPFIHLPAGAYEIQFLLRPAWKAVFATRAIAIICGHLMRVDPRWVRRNPEVAVVDVCCGSDGQVRASRVLRVSDFPPWASYQAFKLTFHSNGEKLFQFRVFATGALPVHVDPYRTWASIEALDDRA